MKTGTHADVAVVWWLLAGRGGCGIYSLRNVADGMAFDVPNVAKKSFFRSFCN